MSENGIKQKHPRGMYILFFTEMWERFSYYGMRALLVLFMVDQVKNGGMGLDDATANSIYGLYTCMVYLACLPGGWIADRLLGAQRSVWYGGIIIAAGHFSLAIPSTTTFFLGLVLVILGTGMLKPNISAVVGQLYPEGGARRDAGFTIFYMGINLGAFLGPLVCSSLGESERFGWHWGFGAAGAGMVLGLIQYRFTSRFLGDAGREPGHRRDPALGTDPAWYGVLACLGVVVVTVGMALAGAYEINPVALAKGTTYVIVGMAVLYFGGVFIFAKLDSVEKKRVVVIIVLFIASAMFWSGFEQAGSSLNLFADRYTDRIVMGWEVPAGWFQSLPPAFIIAFAPVFAAMWVSLARRNLNPTMPIKFALGLVLLAIGFAVMFFASKLVADNNAVLPTWLFFTYLFHTMGEICISPVGLSAVTKLAPKRFVGQMMGAWFMATALGNLVAGILASRFDPSAVGEMPGLYFQIVMTSFGVGLLLLIFSKPVQKLTGGIK
jgi:POT family proton-dependent oligopeptide transporter